MKYLIASLILIVILQTILTIHPLVVYRTFSTSSVSRHALLLSKEYLNKYKDYFCIYQVTSISQYMTHNISLFHYLRLLKVTEINVKLEANVSPLNYTVLILPKVTYVKIVKRYSNSLSSETRELLPVANFINKTCYYELLIHAIKVYRVHTHAFSLIINDVNGSVVVLLAMPFIERLMVKEIEWNISHKELLKASSQSIINAIIILIVTIVILPINKRYRRLWKRITTLKLKTQFIKH